MQIVAVFIETIPEHESALKRRCESYTDNSKISRIIKAKEPYLALILDSFDSMIPS